MNKQFLPSLIIIIIIGVVGYALLKNDGSDQKQSFNASTDSDLSNQSNQDIKIEDIKVGEGPEAIAGKTVAVHYVGTLTNGTKFDSSRDREEPFEFLLEAGQVIPGWDKGVAGMKVGGIRKLTIPPELAYGDQDLGKIPPNSTLVFEIELLEVK